ncbi:helix-turn-helix domain-containing protein [Ructibacterium gallinarum]|uniref:Helix-turn-helix transcriptional regulator n=1 Tax=Ructibacterium gallinarum TaxID=2779355 RepID=A0A9D5M083_9FIRM|nr:helix-turn-helix transcriptional regulator [Ructibacterium gallinarum]MBE5039068.1 helix-turn-helix transcriptional regulator [Ructibacterium gallinarum]
MMVNYKKLWIMLVEKGMSKVSLRHAAGFSSSTLTKLNRNELVALSVLVNICHVLKCDIGDIMEVVPEE